MKHLRLLIITIAVAMAAVAVSALDLPVKTVNGRPYYYYEVQPKDDIYTICERLGVTRNDIVRHNPAVNSDGLRRGQTLYFPVESSESPVSVAESQSETVHLVKKGETLYGIANNYGVSEESIIAINPGARGVLKAGMALVIPVAAAAADVKPAVADVVETGDAIVSPTDPVVAETAVPADAPTVSPETFDVADVTEELVATTDTIRVTLMLPFMLNEQQPSKSAQLYTEFFKGFMLAVDSLRNYGVPLIVTAVDTENSAERVDELLQQSVVKNSDLIIGPDDETQLNAISAVAASNAINLLNIFAVKNQAYLTNPFVLQANIPHSQMYSQAVASILSDFSEYTPVLLQPTQGKSDKAEFQQLLRQALTDAGKEYVDIPYSNVLRGEDLASLDPARRYLFVPSSGTTTEFSRIYTALRAYKDGLDDMSLVSLFGYPEWITFRSDALEKIHYMNSTIYSRFYNDPQSLRSSDFARNYESRYGSPMLNAIPLQGILGFDTGMYVIKTLNANLRPGATEFDTMYDGIQCDYRFVGSDNVAGRINDSLYFITFRPSGFVDKRSL